MYPLLSQLLKVLRAGGYLPSYRLTVLPSFVFASTLAGQSVDERRQIDAFRDTLHMVTDTMALRERQALMLRAAARSRSEPFYHLYLGTLALRQGELGGPPHLDLAAAEFRWAAMLAPNWSYAWYGAGMAELALGARLAMGSSEDPRREPLSQEAYSRGAQAIARALALEPQLAALLEPFARRALRDGCRDGAIAIRDGLAAFSGKLRAPRRLLALGRVQRELDDSTAMGTFAEYMRSGDNRALALVELGRTQLSQGDPRGATRYFAAAAENDSIATAELRSDLAVVASEADLGEFIRRSGPARADFLRQFWTVRDRLGLRPDGDRLVEHFRRIMVARANYLIFGEDGVERFDDRGKVYIRHGEPDDRVTLAAPGVEPNESWGYRRGSSAHDGLVLHFVARHNPREFSLVESVWDIATGRGLAELLRSRAPLDPMYREVPARPDQLTALKARERTQGRGSMRLALATDEFPLQFAARTAMWGQVLVTGGNGAIPLLQIIFVAPRAGASPSRLARVRFVALDTTSTVVASADSSVTLDSNGAGRFTIPVRSGRLITHAALEVGLAGSELGIDTLWVPAPGGRDVGLGSLLIGSDAGLVSLPLANGGEFRLAADQAVPRSGLLRLGAFVFGLSVSERAEVQVLVSPDSVSGGRRKWRSMRLHDADRVVTRDRNRGAIAMWRGAVSLRDLVPGRYRIALIASAGSGRSARQEGEVVVGQP